MITLFKTEINRMLGASRSFRELRDRIKLSRFPFDVRGPQGSYLAYVLHRIEELEERGGLVVVPTEQEAERLIGDLELFGTQARYFPWWGSAPYREISSNSANFGKRSAVLSHLAAGGQGIVVAPLRAVLSPVPPAEALRGRLLELRLGQSLDPIELSGLLERYGYFRVPRTTVRGEYSLRGEVLDIYPPADELPVRIVFEFDEIEEIKRFEAGSQASTRKLEHVTLYPGREVIWDEERIDALEEAAVADPGMAEGRDELIEALRERRRVEGEEIYYPLAYETPTSILDYVSAETPIYLTDYERLGSAAEALSKEYAGLYRTERVHRPVPRPERLLIPFEDIVEQSSAVRFPLLQGDGSRDSISLSYEAPRSFFGNVDFLKEELASLAEAGYRTFVFADSQSQAERLGYLLKDFDIEVIAESISAGFSLPDLKLLVIQENEIFGRRKRAPRSVAHTESEALDSFVELTPGDYVVHVNYGIGLFKGIKRIAAAGNERDYIHLEYAGDEFLYIPIEQVNLIQRYIGHGDTKPRLDTIGGKSWERRKKNVRKNVEDLAEHLISLYSRRKKSRGYAFPKDTEWQMEFEAAFPYRETADQLHCIEEVKADMEKPLPMDRLICGDVGYGKTEVAMRATFKAVSTGKQVAFLAPTTILAEQHYENLSDRLESFPVRTGMLSRFVPRARQKEVLAGLASGEIDVVVGTHRLLQKDVIFKDLGLIVVDEEQRFGVKDKERLKEMKTSVDSLALTATPIPRTLHMALLRIRDMSVLRTPPETRLPIETIIREFDDKLVVEAIRRELDRGGQVYYLHNRVETLAEVQRFIQKVVPEVMVELAHGQMSSTELEDIMHRFVHGGFQVLVATTIIENGIDIPNVNTIIIDRSDMYGISQLYQLRGRVGRSNRLAYAYLFYPEERALSELAMKRLQIISDYTELGSGFKIALKDLEVRGAGNLLGREQSGDILSVGFDMYLKLLDDAVRKLTEEDSTGGEEVYLELDYSGFVPDSYVSEAAEKMEVYKKIASISTEEELEAVNIELEDRFGPLPDEVNSLLSLAEIRILGRRLRVASLRERGGVLEVEFSKVADLSVDRVLSMIEAGGGRVRLNPKKPNALIMDTGNVGLKEKSEFIRGRLAGLVAG